MVHMIQDEHIQTLTEVGLTLLQAKTYLALAELGKADVKTITKDSNVARQDTYRIMSQLQKLGLAEKILTKPTMYKATPIKEGLSILLQNKKEEYTKLKKKTTSLVSNFHTKKAKLALLEERTQFIITSEMTLFLKIHRNQAHQAQESVDIMIPLISVPSKFEDEWLYLKAPLKRGVKIRVIKQESEEKTILPVLQTLAKNPSFELRYLAAPIHFGMHIFDKEEVTIQISEKVLPSLWSNNPHVVELAASYFNEMWNKTQ